MPTLVDFRLLGPVSMAGPDGPAILYGPRQRTLVALLALNAGRVVPVSRLVDALWGENPPRTALRSLHSHVSRVRVALASCGLADVLVTRDPGYLLQVPAERVDVHLFEDAVRRARADLAAGAPGRAAEALQTGLGLWRGDAFADGEPEGWAAAEAGRLNELRVAAYEDLAEVCLQLGQFGPVLADLDRLLVTYPSRERLAGLHMLALHRGGRSAEALERYELLRAHLADQLGADPGPWLRDVHLAILRGDDGGGMADELTHPVPAQLPPPVGHFAGRQLELTALERSRAGPGGGVVVVCGAPGLGKTALATEWAHRLREEFPDGQIFCDLRGHHPDSALTASEALNHVLRGLGVPADRVPVSADEQREVYRSLIDGRRVLILLDDAATVDHILPLVPTRPTSLLLITSRHRLAGLHAYHAVHTVAVDALGQVEAYALLESVLGVDRVAAERDAAQDLVERCGRVPLAIRIAAARLTARPRLPIARLAAELTGEDSLDALEVEGDSRSVRSVFATAHQALSEPAALIFNRLGLYPGPTFTPYLAAAAAGVSFGRARRGVGELAASHLVTETEVDRYRLHDLIRLYAAERARIDETQADRDLVVQRILDWTVTVVEAANRVLDPGRDRVHPTLRHRPDVLPFDQSAEAALSFLDGERRNVIAMVEYASGAGHLTHAWQLSYLVAGYFDSRGHAADRVRVFQSGLVAARTAGDQVAEALMHNGLGIALIAAHRYDDALGELRQALRLMRSAGDQRGSGHAYNNIGVALMRLHRYPEAIAACEQALAVHTINRHCYGTILALLNLGGQCALIGDFARGLGLLARGLALARGEGDVRLESAVLHTTAEAYRLMGDDRAAASWYEDSLRLRRQAGIDRYAATTLVDIGDVQARAGDLNPARDSFAEALAIGEHLPDPHVCAVALAHLGRAELAAGNLGPARDQLERALSVRIRVPDALEEANIQRSLGELEVRSDRIGPAQVHWDRAILLYEKANATTEAKELAVLMQGGR